MQTSGVHSKSSDDWIASITYRSEAVIPPDPPGLRDLVTKAQSKNRTLGVTGMLLSDGQRFLQTLEGPPDSVDRVWSAIERDPRHCGIEVLSQHIAPSRLFSGWDMQFYHRDLHPAGKARQAVRTTETLTRQVATLAQFALDGDDGKLNALVADLIAQGWAADALITHLLEPAARVLGDAWLADDCSGLDLTIALSMLQLAGHVIHCEPDIDVIRSCSHSILLVTAPGEPHMLGTSLLGEIFIRAGWNVDIAFPENDEALAREVRSKKPDAVDIAMSDALPRQYALETLRETVEKSRRASPGELMVVSVGGRLFAEATATAMSVGADLARTSAAGTSVRLGRLVERRLKGKPSA